MIEELIQPQTKKQILIANLSLIIISSRINFKAKYMNSPKCNISIVKMLFFQFLFKLKFQTIPQMKAEVIKLSSQTNNNISSIISELSTKLQANRPYEITLILKHNEEIQAQHVTTENNSSEEEQINLSLNATQLKNSNNFSDAIFKKPQFLTEKVLNKKSGKSFTSFGNKKSVTYRDQIQSIQQNNFAVQTSFPQLQQLNVQNQNEKDGIKQINSKESIRKEENSIYSAGESQFGQLIESKLNKAQEYLEKDDILGLQNFLYQLKQKDIQMTVRSQIKWSLLMAHCKQHKLEFERAASHYRQITQILSENEINYLFISIADAYHRQAVCLYRIQEYNASITAFAKAINLYQLFDHRLQYALAINNLGALYLEVDHSHQAEKCFLMSFKIRQELLPSKSQAQLIPVLFNILECNFRLRNLKQCENILNLIQRYVQSDDNEQSSYFSLSLVKKAKLEYLKGNLDKSKLLCEKAKFAFQNGVNGGCILAEISELEGMIKLESKNYKEARESYIKAIKLVKERCLPTESRKVENLKNNIQITVKDRSSLVSNFS